MASSASGSCDPTDGSEYDDQYARMDKYGLRQAVRQLSSIRVVAKSLLLNARPRTQRHEGVDQACRPDCVTYQPEDYADFDVLIIQLHPPCSKIPLSCCRTYH